MYASGNNQLFPLHFVWKQGKKINIRSEEILLVSMDGIPFF
jgi:hypothetical protein